MKPDFFSHFLEQIKRRDQEMFIGERRRLAQDMARAQAEALKQQMIDEWQRTTRLIMPPAQPANPFRWDFETRGGTLEKALVAGPILAWRVWKIRQDGVLLSVSQNCEWPIGTPLVGEPASRNDKGIYACKTREFLGTHEYGRDCLAGKVALWGKVIEHERGYRAQYAYPYAIDLSSPAPMPGFPASPRRGKLAQLLRDNYGCEVIE